VNEMCFCEKVCKSEVFESLVCNILNLGSYDIPWMSCIKCEYSIGA
jgi:hypothetical protein